MRTEKSYVKELKSFAKWAEVEKVQDVEVGRLDGLLVMYFEELWLKGEAPSRGMKVIASVLHVRPQFGKVGSQGLPRSWRALKG